MGGQYDYPKGLFYGGNKLERGPEILLAELGTLVGNAEQVILIDFHTGLGKSGSYALLVDAEAGSAQHIALHEQYGERIQPWSADHGVAYKISGGLPDAVVHLLGDRAQVLTCEFGTLPGLKVLQALRAENQSHHWGGRVDEDKKRLMNAFRRPLPTWEKAVLDGGAYVIEQALTQLRS